MSQTYTTSLNARFAAFGLAVLLTLATFGGVNALATAEPAAGAVFAAASSPRA